ncbi:MAG: protein translocase subunit SecD, partial [Alphaproteobacteria bacterium]|nr:protein translocase subunit SecD [Alphaproteobacteria bacterium]
MYKLSKQRVLIILGICAVGIFLALPNVMPKSVKLPSWWQPVSLGLDLQGGSNLLLEVEMDEVIRERMGLLEDAVRQSLREHRIRYQNLSAGNDSVKVKIENSGSRTQAIGYFKKLEDGLDVSVGENGMIELKYTEAALNMLKHRVVDQSIEIVRRRIDELGTKEPVIQSQGEDRIVVQLPGIQNPEEVKALLGKTAKMSFHLVDSRTTAADAKRGKLSNSSRVINSAEGGQLVIQRKPVVSGENL